MAYESKWRLIIITFDVLVNFYNLLVFNEW